MLVMTLLVGDNKIPSKRIYNIEYSQYHSYAASSVRFTLPRSRKHISPGPGRFDFYKADLKR